MRALLTEGFDYDEWANLAWIEALPRFKDPETARGIMAHVLKAQRIWLTRCVSEEEIPEFSADQAEAVRFAAGQWRELMRVCDPSAYVSYTTLAGEPCFNMLEEIARHVINHGTYHRGELRGLARAEGLEDFPETDFVRFLRVSRAG